MPSVVFLVSVVLSVPGAGGTGGTGAAITGGATEVVVVVELEDVVCANAVPVIKNNVNAPAASCFFIVCSPFVVEQIWFSSAAIRDSESTQR